MHNKIFNKIIIFSMVSGLSGLLLMAAPVAAQEAPVVPPVTPVIQKADPDEESKRSLDMSAMLGAHIDPGNFVLAIDADLYTAPYFSFGPLLQVGFFDTRTFVEATLGGKFHFVPKTLTPLELHYQAGAGYFYRRANGFDFHNFVFVTGPGVDIMIKKPLAFTAAFLVNVSNDAVDELFYTALAGVKYVF